MKNKKGKSCYLGRKSKRIGALLVVLLLSGLFGCGKKDTYIVSSEETENVEALQDQETLQNPEAIQDPEVFRDSEDLKASAPENGDAVQAVKGRGQRIYVHVCGAVKYPGVYEFSGDTRVFQAVESAGGLLPEAHEAALNQAQAVKDGERIYVPTTEEWERKVTDVLEENLEQKEEEPDDGLVNINTADETTLCTLPGVGATRAKAIVEYRSEHGSFEKIEDIQNVSGIKSGLFKKIKDFIKTE